MEPHIQICNNVPFLAIAIREALKVRGIRGVRRHGAIIFSKNRILSRGSNTRKESPFSFSNGYISTHAEISAIGKVKFFKYTNLNALVVRLTHDGKLANSRPCEVCISILKASGVKKVFYSVDSGDIMCEAI